MQVVLRPEHKYLILCSDGIYEFMDNQYIMSIVHHQALNGWTPTDVAKALVNLPDCSMTFTLGYTKSVLKFNCSWRCLNLRAYFGGPRMSFTENSKLHGVGERPANMLMPFIR